MLLRLPTLYDPRRMLTIIREPQTTDHAPGDPDALALAALGWMLQDEGRAQR